MRRKLRRLLEKLGGVFLSGQTPVVDTGTQLLLTLTYKELLHDHQASLPSIDEVGFRNYSGSDEDGILLYIFSLVGVTNKRVVDIGAGRPAGSNTANLIIHHGWIGLLIDGRESDVRFSQEYYARLPDTRLYPPTVVHAWVTAENVNALLTDNGFLGEIDLLSIDIDGMDYWVWKAIDAVDPRVVVVEYHDILGPDRALTIPYKPDFNYTDYEVNDRYPPDYVGSSLLAFVKLAKQKGYRLVGCNRYGWNAFFVRSGLAEGALPEVPVESCFTHPWNEYGMRHRYPRVKDMEWLEV